jgi:putative Holliday junction resolvase
MPRIIALDLGKKRTGVAVSDENKIIATGLDTVDTDELIGYLKRYMKENEVEKILVGYPLNLDGSVTDGTPVVEKFIIKFGNVFPNMPVVKADERFTSKMARLAIGEMGLKKKDKEDKGLKDRISAVLILQDYLQNGG